jgi:primosomal protein N''
MARNPKRFKRRLFGYRRAAVDARLDELTTTIEALENQSGWRHRTTTISYFAPRA